MTASKTSFPKTERIKQAADFRILFKQARMVRENGLALYFLKTPGPKKSRLGIVVSRRVLKNATDRNRVKRKIREFFRLHKADFQSNFDLIARVTDGSKLLEINNLDHILTRIFKRAGVLNHVG